MRAIFRFLLILVCLMALRPLQAQTAYFQLDKPYYFHGEYMFYTLFLGEIKTDSAVLLFRLTKEGVVLEQHYHAYDKGYISGYFKLPHDLPSGICEIQAFAFDKKSGEAIDLLNTPVSIFGEDTPTKRPTQFIVQKPLVSAAQNSTIHVDFSSHEDQKPGFTYCTIDGLAAGTIQLSINFRKFTEGAKTPVNIRYFEHKLNSRSCAEELSILSYKKSSDSLASQSALLYAIQPEALQFKLASANPSGKVNFEFPRLYGIHEIQFLDFFLSLPVQLDPSPIPEPGKPEILYVPDTDIAAAYVLFQKRKQIFQLFKRLPYSVISENIGVGQKLPQADFEVDVQDYAIKGKLADLFSEIISPLIFRKKKGENSIRIFYKIKGRPMFHKYPPVFIVNGVATLDADYIHSLLLQEVKTVRIFSEPQTLKAIVGSYHIGGLVVIELIDHLVKLPEEKVLPGIRVMGIQRPISYPIMGDTNSPTPRIQSLLYWAPHHFIDARNQVQFAFPTTDITGRYAMDMLVQDARGNIYVESIQLSFDGKAWHRIAH